MKHYAKLFIAVVTVLLILTGCPGTFTGSDLSDADITAAQQELNNSEYGVSALTVGAWTKPEGDGTFDVGIATGQVLRGTFGGAIDAATLSAVVFYPLTAAAMADGAYTRSTPLTYTTDVTYLPGSNETQVDFIFNITSGAGISDEIEIFIDPTVLTANGGATMLNEDMDTVQGESQDDDYIGYFTVDSGSTIVAVGNPRDPLPGANLTATTPLSTVAGQTQIVWNAQNALGTVGTTKAALDAVYRIEKFNLTTTTWETVTTTTALNTTTGDYTVTLPAATAAGESYREISINPSTYIETVTVNGYAAKGSYNQSVTWQNMGTTTIAGTMVWYNDTVGFTFNTSSDAGYKGIIEITLTGIGVLGIDPTTVTADNLKIYDTVNDVYVPWMSAEVQKSVPLATQANDQIILTLNPAYNFTGAAGVFELHFGPGLTDLGATTVAGDNLKLGDWTNTNTVTYGFRIEPLGAV